MWRCSVHKIRLSATGDDAPGDEESRSATPNNEEMDNDLLRFDGIKKLNDLLDQKNIAKDDAIRKEVESLLFSVTQLLLLFSCIDTRGHQIWNGVKYNQKEDQIILLRGLRIIIEFRHFICDLQEQYTNLGITMEELTHVFTQAVENAQHIYWLCSKKNIRQGRSETVEKMLKALKDFLSDPHGWRWSLEKLDREALDKLGIRIADANAIGAVDTPPQINIDDMVFGFKASDALKGLLHEKKVVINQEIHDKLSKLDETIDMVRCAFSCIEIVTSGSGSTIHYKVIDTPKKRQEILFKGLQAIVLIRKYMLGQREDYMRFPAQISNEEWKNVFAKVIRHCSQIYSRGCMQGIIHSIPVVNDMFDNLLMSVLYPYSWKWPYKKLSQEELESLHIDNNIAVQIGAKLRTMDREAAAAGARRITRNTDGAPAAAGGTRPPRTRDGAAAAAAAGARRITRNTDGAPAAAGGTRPPRTRDGAAAAESRVHEQIKIIE
jgi:hypothetical protein